ncbi:MAG: rRNA maturation RNase YbeY [Gemmatimonadetes bacterium]|nr:rRNA maturation RNase YbeY [Gemmatimonadota bacterium]
MGVSGTRRPALPAALVRRVVGAVLDGEGAGEAAFSVTFVGAGGMRTLNRRTFGRDRVTDVIAFGLPHLERQGGDLYLCPAAARAAAKASGVPLAEELVRVLVHGTLHALGYDHPEGDGRTGSRMWRRQEWYVRALLARAR